MTRIKEVIAPNLTPFNADYTADSALYVDHARSLLEQGCTMLAPFGTTGEANSLGLAERMQLLEAMVAGGIPASKIIPGTGLCALPDTVFLSKHAMELGSAGVMTLPPFYYKDVSDEGLFAYFARLVESVGRNDLRIYLYHIPQVAKVGLSIALTQRLAREFPKIIVGIKDSSGDWDNSTSELLSLENFTVFPGSEIQLCRALKAGAAGCITATANINAKTIRRLAENYRASKASDLEAIVDKFRKTIQPFGPIPAMKALLARRDRHEGWARVRAPLLAMDLVKGSALDSELAVISQAASTIAV